MSDGIFLIDKDGRLQQMGREDYVTEDLLQELIAKYPNLIPGDQINSDSPRRWLLITREAGVPSESDGGSRWSVDHLFLDQEGIPTLVEVKRSSDTRIRREVVGQMLDYAANAVVFWPVEQIFARFEQQCEKEGINPDEAVSNLVGNEGSVGDFWKMVKTNLLAGRVRLLFVADVIPKELRRIVEFLNTQMDPAEMLAVEIRQFVGENVRALVPRLFGQTTEAQSKKAGGVRETKMWDEPSFFEAIKERRGVDEMHPVHRILSWAVDRNLEIQWKQGSVDGSLKVRYNPLGIKEAVSPLFNVYTYGAVEIQFQYLRKRPPYESKEKRQEMRERLNAIEGVHIAESKLDARPNLPLSALTNQESLKKFLDTFDWVVLEVKTSSETKETH